MATAARRRSRAARSRACRRKNPSEKVHACYTAASGAHYAARRRAYVTKHRMPFRAGR
jgi:hypothetical protein